MRGNRKRSPNFTPQEETYLLELVENNKNIVECRKTDAISNKMKSEIWERIAVDFNSKGIEILRSALNLRRKYENLKKIVKNRSSQKVQSDDSVEANQPLTKLEKITLMQIVDDLGDYFSKHSQVPKMVWEEITSEFNDTFDDYKSEDLLMEEYNKLKKMKCTENIPTDRSGTKRRASGRCDYPLSSSTEDENVLSEEERLTDFDFFQCEKSNNIDPQSKSAIKMTSIKTEVYSGAEQMETRGFPECEILENVDYGSNWSKCTPLPIPPPLFTKSTIQNKSDKIHLKKRKNQSTSSSKRQQAKKYKVSSILTKSKLELTKIQRQAFMDEHNIKLKLMTEKANKEMELMEREADLRLQFAREENKIKLEILVLQKKQFKSKIAIN